MDVETIIILNHFEFQVIQDIYLVTYLKTVRMLEKISDFSSIPLRDRIQVLDTAV